MTEETKRKMGFTEHQQIIVKLEDLWQAEENEDIAELYQQALIILNDIELLKQNE